MKPDPSPELLTERQALTVLSRRAITPRHARHALQAGLAGEPARTRVATLYDAKRVHALLEWTGVPAEAGRTACPHGLFVGRRLVSVLGPSHKQLEKAAASWRISGASRLWFYRWFEECGPMPVVVTIAGFVLFGAELFGFRSEGTGTRLVLQEAGDWFSVFEEHRLSTWSGNAWTVVGTGRRGTPRQD